MSLFELIESMLSKTHCSGQTFGFGITVPKHGKAQTAGRCSTSTQLRNARRARFIMVCLAECGQTDGLTIEGQGRPYDPPAWSDAVV